MNNPESLEDLLSNYISDPQVLSLCAMKLRMMAQGPSTNSLLLYNALEKILDTFPGNDQKIEEGINRLYSAFLRRTT